MHKEGSSQRIADQFRELTTETEIAQYLNLAGSQTLTSKLEKAGYIVLASIKTTRRKYKLEPFMIDMDSMDFGYELAEIELLVSNQPDMEAAVEKIVHFAKGLGLETVPVRGKLIEFIRRNKPELFRALGEAGVV